MVTAQSPARKKPHPCSRLIDHCPCMLKRSFDASHAHETPAEMDIHWRCYSFLMTMIIEAGRKYNQMRGTQSISGCSNTSVSINSTIGPTRLRGGLPSLSGHLLASRHPLQVQLRAWLQRRWVALGSPRSPAQPLAAAWAWAGQLVMGPLQPCAPTCDGIQRQQRQLLAWTLCDAGLYGLTGLICGSGVGEGWVGEQGVKVPSGGGGGGGAGMGPLQPHVSTCNLMLPPHGRLIGNHRTQPNKPTWFGLGLSSGQLATCSEQP